MIKATKSREFIPALQITPLEIRAAVQRDLDRRKKFLERSKILNDDLKGIVDSQIALMFDRETYEDMRPYIDVSNNLMRRIVRETSTLYKDEHERTVKPASSQKQYEEMIGEEGLNLNSRMQKYNELLNGLNDLILKVEAAAGELDLTLLTPDMCTVIQNPLSPYMLDAIIIEDSWRDQAGQMRHRWIFWSPGRHFILDEDFKMRAPAPDNPDMLNPYWEQNMDNEAFYPFIAMHNGIRDKCFWEMNQGNDLVEATKCIAMKNTFLYFMFPMQFKQLAVKGNFDDGKEFKNRQIKSPLHIMKSDSEFNVLDWQSSLKELDERIQSHLFMVASNYGVSAENFKLTATETSGFARMIAKERLLEIRKEQIPTHRKAEVELFDGARVANNLYDLDKEISEEAEVSIDYKEPEFKDDPLKELTLKERKIELGLINPLDLIKEENPDIKNDEEAEEMLNRNIEIRNRLKSRFSLTNPLTSDKKPKEKEGV
jgi:hypothetical protein